MTETHSLFVEYEGTRTKKKNDRVDRSAQKFETRSAMHIRPPPSLKQKPAKSVCGGYKLDNMKHQRQIAKS